MIDTPSLIFLIGMPGVGKSYLGKYAAAKKGWRFIDLDLEIEREGQMSIPQIFEQLGESEFRKLEFKCLTQLIEQCHETAIIATGGGAPCFNNSMELMNCKGKTVWIDGSIDYIYQNIENQKKDRPLFETTIKDELIVKLNLMYEQRKAFYGQSMVKVNVYKGYSPDLFTNTVHLSTFGKGA